MKINDFKKKLQHPVIDVEIQENARGHLKPNIFEKIGSYAVQWEAAL